MNPKELISYYIYNISPIFLQASNVYIRLMRLLWLFSIFFVLELFPLWIVHHIPKLFPYILVVLVTAALRRSWIHWLHRLSTLAQQLVNFLNIMLIFTCYLSILHLFETVPHHLSSIKDYKSQIFYYVVAFLYVMYNYIACCDQSMLISACKNLCNFSLIR